MTETSNERRVWNGLVEGGLVADHRKPLCGETSSEGLGCTRAMRHTGQHVATGPHGEVYETWTEEVKGR
jgi:hypothetical protein